EERVVEEPEGAERAGGAHVGIVAPALELFGGAERVGRVEEPLVRHVADDGEPPGDLLEAVAACGGDHEEERVPVDRGEGRVALADVEAEGVLGEGPGVHDEAELAAHLVARGRVLDHAFYGPAPAEELALLDARADEVTGRAGEGCGGEAGDGEDREELLAHGRSDVFPTHMTPGAGEGFLDPHRIP